MRKIALLDGHTGMPLCDNQKAAGAGADAVIATDEVEDVPAKVKEITGGELAYGVRAYCIHTLSLAAQGKLLLWALHHYMPCILASFA